MSEPHQFKSSPILEADQTPIKAKVPVRPIARVPVPASKKIADEKPAAERPCPERHGEKEKPGIVVGYDFKAAAACPVCAERKAKQAAATKRWREKKK